MPQNCVGGENLYGKITVIFLVLASASYITGIRALSWDIGSQLCFLSYFLVGYKIRKWAENKKSNTLAIALIVGGLAVNVGLGIINFQRGLSGLPVDVINFKQNPFSYTPLAPIEVVASCLIFAGFSVMKINKNFSKLSGYTFLIYLIHAAVIDVMWVFIGNRLLGSQIVETVSVIVISTIVFVVSFVAAVVYKKIVTFGKNSQNN